jgi:hypothetical protein
MSAWDHGIDLVVVYHVREGGGLLDELLHHWVVRLGSNPVPCALGALAAGPRARLGA